MALQMISPIVYGGTDCGLGGGRTNILAVAIAVARLARAFAFPCRAICVDDSSSRKEREGRQSSGMH